MSFTLSRPSVETATAISRVAADAPPSSPDATPSLGEPFANRVRWTRDVCDDLERYGFLPARYELIDGEIISKMGQNPPHVVALGSLLKWIRSIYGEDFVLGQAPVQVSEPDRPTFRPEPDAAAYVLPLRSYVASAPGPGDVRFVAEVSDSTLRDDLTLKASLYARAGFPEYWVLDITGRRVVIHRAPADGIYGVVFVVADGGEVTCEGAPDRPVAVTTLFAPRQVAPEAAA